MSKATESTTTESKATESKATESKATEIKTFLTTFLHRPMTMSLLRMGEVQKEEWMKSVTSGDLAFDLPDVQVTYYTPKSSVETILESDDDAPGRTLAPDVGEFMSGMQKCLAQSPVGQTPAWAANDTHHAHDHRVWYTHSPSEAKVTPVKWLRTGAQRHRWAMPQVNLGCVDASGMYYSVMFHRKFPPPDMRDESRRKKFQEEEAGDYDKFRQSISDLWMKTLSPSK